MQPDQLAQLMLLAYATTAVGLMLTSKRRCRDGWRVWLLFLIERVHVAFVYHWRANRRCPFPDSSGALIVANHRCPVDPQIVWMNSHLRHEEHQRSIRVIGFLMAREYYEKPGLIGWISRAMQSIPVERDGRDVGATRQALRRLEAGDLIAIFPEGGIHTKDNLRTANAGVAYLALRSAVPVILVYIQGAPRCENMIAPFYTPSRVRVTYGTPLDLSEWRAQRRTPELLQELTDSLMRKLADLGGVKYEPDEEKSVT